MDQSTMTGGNKSMRNFPNSDSMTKGSGATTSYKKENIFRNAEDIQQYLDDPEKGYCTKVIPGMIVRDQDFAEVLANPILQAGKFYRFSDTTVPDPGDLDPSQELDPRHQDLIRDIAQDAEIRKAGIIAFGGLKHVDARIDQVAQMILIFLDRLDTPVTTPELEEERNAPRPRHSDQLIPDGLLVFNPEVCSAPRTKMGPTKLSGRLRERVDPGQASARDHAQQRLQERVRECYEWNKNKAYTPEKDTEIERVANQIFTHKFLDKSGEKLVPLKETVPGEETFKPFTVFTYSMGGRISFILENVLIKKINAQLKKENPDITDDEIPKITQRYFDNINRVCVGSAPDPVDTLEDRPCIPTTHVIAELDRGIAFRGITYDALIKPDHPHPIPEGEFYRKQDLASHEKPVFSGPDGEPLVYPGMHHQQVIAFSSKAVTDDALNEENHRLHGLEGYTEAMWMRLPPEEKQALIPPGPQIRGAFLQHQNSPSLPSF